MPSHIIARVGEVFESNYHIPGVVETGQSWVREARWWGKRRQVALLCRRWLHCPVPSWSGTLAAVARHGRCWKLT